ncbi:ABC transporter permease [Comamonas composti]|uniref:ABC transporter permease n=1 Tax=Comamonas composti TaxID=408558 RepID=UPI000A03D7B0|nr:ABC transporter permease [Comamonas composti]
MNPHAAHPSSFIGMLKAVWCNRQLIFRMTRREISGRYRGSLVGIFWSLLNPLFMLAIYTFVFSVIFKARWGVEEAGRGEFAIVLFAGLIVYGFFAEVINKAPQLILGNVNYVKKVVFPLEVLPVVHLLVACFQVFVSLCVLLVAQFVVNKSLSWTVLLFPVVMTPLLVLTQGLAWIIASLGVFIRDIGQVMTLLTSVLLFMSPVFFPLKSLPENFQPWMQANPLTFIIEQVRGVLVFGEMPNIWGLFLYFLISLLFSLIGFKWFQKTRKGFADVL